MGGMWSKWFLALATLDAGKLSLLAVLMVSTLLNVAYLMPIPIRAFFSSDKATATGIKEAPLPCLIALIISAIGCMLLFFFV